MAAYMALSLEGRLPDIATCQVHPWRDEQRNPARNDLLPAGAIRPRAASPSPPDREKKRGSIDPRAPVTIIRPPLPPSASSRPSSPPLLRSRYRAPLAESCGRRRAARSALHSAQQQRAVANGCESRPL